MWFHFHAGIFPTFFSPAWFRPQPPFHAHGLMTVSYYFAVVVMPAAPPLPPAPHSLSLLSSLGSPSFLPFLPSSLLQHSNTLFTKFFVMGTVMSGVLGFMMGIVTVMQIRATSPLTHNISGTAKAGVQSAMAFYIWGNEATLGACLGELQVAAADLPHPRTGLPPQ